MVSRNQKIFEQAGSIINYRCVTCRDCTNCKENESTAAISIKEEVEQHLINQSVTVDVLKADVLKSEKKLHSMGYVDYVRNMTKEQQQMLVGSKIQNFVPWRAVWNENSLSTTCRIVFDASHPTRSGYSLNSILAKGTNNMNKLVELLIRWTSHHTAFHTDIRKMYNTVKLREKHWCLQRYIWQEDLDHSKLPEEKVIKTLIYGVKSSGNQSERQTSRLFQDEYPKVNKVVEDDIYIDDCFSGDESQQAASDKAEDLETVVNRGGFCLKGVTFSNEDPKDCLLYTSPSPRDGLLSRMPSSA